MTYKKYFFLGLFSILLFEAGIIAQSASSIINPEFTKKAARQKSKEGFSHPGILQSSADLERIKKNVKDSIEPWKNAWNTFENNKWIASNYEPMPLDTVGRGLGSKGQDNIQNDCTAAYYNAIAWYVTGDTRYAQKAIEIINGWSYQLKLINGKDAVLCSGIYGYKFANAAEIIRYTYPNWSKEDILQCEQMLKTVFYPVIKDFAPFANGNWESAAINTVMSIGIFCNDRQMFESAIKYYAVGWGDGSLSHYIINENGQSEESGRDQPHTQGGIGHLALACETAYHQGIDLYSLLDNRLLKGFEYTAKYNLGFDVPFEASYDQTGKYNHTAISDQGRGRFSPVYEMVMQHYKNRKGILAPFTQQAAEKLRPEPLSIDHPGAGTLLFTLPITEPKTHFMGVPGSPAGVIAKPINNGIELKWIPSLYSDHYVVKRAASKAGPYQIIAQKVIGSVYFDANVSDMKLYYYTVTAQNTAGISVPSLVSAVYAGLPKGWKESGIGDVPVPGSSAFNGECYSLEGAGAEIGGSKDNGHFIYTILTGNGFITARFVPQVASQSAQFGLMIRDSIAADAKAATLLIMPVATQDKEQPKWTISFDIRTITGTAASKVFLNHLDEPSISWGRLVEPCWLRLTRQNTTLLAAVSLDGKTWKEIGSQPFQSTKIFIGLAVASNLARITTTVHFDHVKVDHVLNKDGK